VGREPEEFQKDRRFRVGGTGSGLIVRPGPRVSEPDPAHLLRDG
jgi:hypothetical protein